MSFNTVVVGSISVALGLLQHRLDIGEGCFEAIEIHPVSPSDSWLSCPRPGDRFRDWNAMLYLGHYLFAQVRIDFKLTVVSKCWG